MPELSRFGGMVIYLLFKDIGQHKIITGWLAFHEEEVYKAWNLALKGEHFDKIPPMK